MMAMSFSSHGDHAGTAYSRYGRTYVMYSFGHIFLSLYKTDLHISPRTLLAVHAAFLHCSSGFSLSEIQTPTSFSHSDLSSGMLLKNSKKIPFAPYFIYLGLSFVEV